MALIGYEYRQRLHGTEEWNAVTDLGPQLDLTEVIAELSADTVYDFQVRGYDVEGIRTAWSNIATAATLSSSGFFEDDFNDNSINPVKWTIIESGDATVEESDEQFKVVNGDPAAGGSFASITSVTLDMEDRQVDLDIVEISDGSTCFLEIEAIAGGFGDFARIFISEGTIFYLLSDNGIGYSSSSEAWGSQQKIRMKHRLSDNKMLFYTDSGSGWSLRFTSAELLWPVDEVKIRIWMQTPGAGGGDGQSFIVDNLVTTIPWP